MSADKKMPFGTRLDDWLPLIRGEFQEVPDLRVTLEQAAVLWNLEPRILELILETFVDVGFRFKDVPDGHTRTSRIPRTYESADL